MAWPWVTEGMYMRYVIVVDDTPEEIEGAIFVLAGMGYSGDQITVTRKAYVFGRRPGGSEPLPPWYTTLPFDARLKVIRDTPVRKAPNDTGEQFGSVYQVGNTTMQYKGEHSNGWLKVYDGPLSGVPSKLWVKADDVTLA